MAKYPQSWLQITFNTLPNQKRRCIQCGSEIPVDDEFHYQVHRPARRKEFKLSFSMCSKGCMMTDALTRRSAILSYQLSDINAYFRDVKQVRTLWNANPPLYEHADFQYLRSDPSYSSIEYSRSGMAIAQKYIREEQLPGMYATQSEIWKKLCSFRKGIDRTDCKFIPEEQKDWTHLIGHHTSHQHVTGHTELAEAQLLRTEMRESVLLSTSTLDTNLLEQCASLCSGLPEWIRWRQIDKLYTNQDRDWSWRKEYFSDDIRQEFPTTFALYEKLNRQYFVPFYTEDEWCQICPDEKEKNRYIDIVLGKIEGPKCYVHKIPIRGQHPFFKPLAWYPIFGSQGHFVFDTRFVLCSAFCEHLRLQDQKEEEYATALVALQEVAQSRWLYFFSVLAAPPTGILPCYSAFTVKDCPLVLEKETEEYKTVTLREYDRLKEMLINRPFTPPSTERDLMLCMSMNYAVFEFLFPPFCASDMKMYPRLSEVFPFGIHKSGGSVRDLLGIFAPESGK